MLRRTERNLENIPVGALGIIALDGCEEMGNRVNDYLVKWRREDGHIHKNDVVFSGYERDNYLINAKVPRFGSEKPRVSSENPYAERYLSYGRCLQLQPDLFSVRTHKSHVPGRSLSESEKNHCRHRRQGPAP